VDPDTGDGDEPGGDQPGGDEPAGDGTHLVYMGADKKVVTDSYFTASESVADFSKEYNGPTFTVDGTAYSYGLKMDSKGSVTFTTSATKTTTVQFWFVRRKSGSSAKMQLVPAEGNATVFDTAWDAPTDSGVITLEKGMGYTIVQKSGEQALILVKVTETE
jgi:hypothetical protein